MKIYISYLKLYVSNSLQYRAAAYAGIITQFAWGLLQIFMYMAFYNANQDSFPMTLPQLSSYFWLQQAFMTLFMTWFLDKDILESIATGNVSYELCRPVNLYNLWFVKSVSNRFSKAIMRFFPILVIASLLPEPYGFIWTNEILTLSLFFISLIAGFLVVVCYIMLIYILTFFTLSPMGIRIVGLSIMEFFSGGIIPLPFLPENIRFIIEASPFGSMQNMPYRIYSGNISGNAAIQSIILQFFWLFFLFILGHLLMKKAISKTVIQGG